MSFDSYGGEPASLSDEELLRCAKIATPCYNLDGWKRELEMMCAAIAAALRAAANQIGMKQPLGETDADAGVLAAHNAINHWLVAIAAELDPGQ